jgi:hypothetical protein
MTLPVVHPLPLGVPEPEPRLYSVEARIEVALRNLGIDVVPTDPSDTWTLQGSFDQDWHVYTLTSRIDTDYISNPHVREDMKNKYLDQEATRLAETTFETMKLLSTHRAADIQVRLFSVDVKNEFEKVAYRQFRMRLTISFYHVHMT